MYSSSSAEPCNSGTGLAWFCVRTHLKHEHLAAAHLRRLAHVDVFNPQLRVLRSTRQGRRWSTECLFPNYVFARFALAAGFEKVTCTPGVKTVLRFGQRVPEIPEAVIDDLRQSVADLEGNVLTDVPLAGEEVEIASGAFAGTTASVIQVLPGKQRARVLLEMLGQSVPAEVRLESVLYKRRAAAGFALTPPAESADGLARLAIAA